MLEALAWTLAGLMMAFGVFFWWLAFKQRGEGRDAVAWGLATGGVNIALGVTVLLGLTMSGAVRYAAAAVVVLLIARFAARRRLLRSGS